MKSLENVFRASYLKGDRSAPAHSPEVAALHNAALIAWCLLLSIAPSDTVYRFVLLTELNHAQQPQRGIGLGGLSDGCECTFRSSQRDRARTGKFSCRSRVHGFVA